eukprot:15401664-Heterocapsa_arctica.AAC.1
MARLATHIMCVGGRLTWFGLVLPNEEPSILQKTYRQPGCWLKGNAFQANSIHGTGPGRRTHQNEVRRGMTHETSKMSAYSELPPR